MPSIMYDYSPEHDDIYWKQSFYIAMAATFLFVSLGFLYYFSDRKLTFKYITQYLFGCDKKDPEYWYVRVCCVCVQRLRNSRW